MLTILKLSYCAFINMTFISVFSRQDAANTFAAGGYLVLAGCFILFFIVHAIYHMKELRDQAVYNEWLANRDTSVKFM